MTQMLQRAAPNFFLVCNYKRSTMIEGRLFAVTYTRRGKLMRLISARKANEREQRQ